LAKGGIVSHDCTIPGTDTNARSISDEQSLTIRVGSLITWVRLKEDMTDKSLLYKKLGGDKKLMLKSPIIHAFTKIMGLKLHKVENRVSNNVELELGGR
jgi:hypothetical protein